MEHWRNYRILIGILLLGLSTSCEKEEFIPSPPTPPPYSAPPVEHNTSIQNHEWNNGWFNNNTHHIDYGGTSPSHFRRGFTYFDYEGDGDMDVFACVPHFENEIDEEHLEYQIIVNKGTIGGVVQWEVKKDIIINQLPYYATLLSPIDIEGDGDMDIVVFVGDDPNNYNGGEPAGGGIFVYVYEDGNYDYKTIEPYVNQEFGVPMDGFFHGGSVGDINGDGLADVVAGTNKIYYWINNGGYNFTKITSYNWQDAANPDYLNQTDGFTFFGDFQNLNGTGMFICSEHMFDINQDGYIDLFVGIPNDDDRSNQGHRKNMRIYYGKAEYPYFNLEPDVILETHIGFDDWNDQYSCVLDISITDWDGDGDYDIFTSSYPNNPNKGTMVSYYQNQNNNSFINKTTEVFFGEDYIYDNCSSAFVKVFDADGDGTKDLVQETGQPKISSECSTINGWKKQNGKLTKYRF